MPNLFILQFSWQHLHLIKCLTVHIIAVSHGDREEKSIKVFAKHKCVCFLSHSLCSTSLQSFLLFLFDYLRCPAVDWLFVCFLFCFCRNNMKNYMGVRPQTPQGEDEDDDDDEVCFFFVAAAYFVPVSFYFCTSCSLDSFAALLPFFAITTAHTSV